MFFMFIEKTLLELYLINEKAYELFLVLMLVRAQCKVYINSKKSICLC